ncbi:DNA repair protein RadC [Breznakibacter xylanolyticus]|uniref:DNA repair protein RadC n=1 Tax=Breznakibacter xylanolyticus TaxID=990 RepID=A0A2W7NN53_9BACT|nr:JAB domain-containing protein [Breznakibacter xylanolyticus]PZX18084.1 DNA repair protein RadC [Breznakibacter xylanolyticus]
MKVSEIKLVYKTKQRTKDRPQVRCSKDAATVFKPFFDTDTIELKEEIHLMLLNASAKVLGVVNLCHGTGGSAFVDKRLIAAAAIKSNAKQVILAHNHPSGNNTPSPDDIISTKEVRKALNLFNISLNDHLIITKTDYYSMADNGEI